MNKIRCLIVDDEPPALALLENYANMIDHLEVVGTSQSAVKAFDLLKDNHIDLMFLDIRMPVLNGIDFIKTLKNPPAIILTTAYREYALDGYDLDIIDYLLKPIPFDRFLKAVDRYSERTAVSASDQLQKADKDAYIICNVNRTNHKIKLDDIRHIESLKDYVRIHLVDSSLVVKGNIGSFMKQLPPEQFVRIHRSYAIALSRVTSYNQTEVHLDDKSFPLGLSFRDGFYELMK